MATDAAALGPHPRRGPKKPKLRSLPEAHGHEARHGRAWAQLGERVPEDSSTSRVYWREPSPWRRTNSSWSLSSSSEGSTPAPTAAGQRAQAGRDLLQQGCSSSPRSGGPSSAAAGATAGKAAPGLRPRSKGTSSRKQLSTSVRQRRISPVISGRRDRPAGSHQQRRATALGRPGVARPPAAAHPLPETVCRLPQGHSPGGPGTACLMLPPRRVASVDTGEVPPCPEHHRTSTAFPGRAQLTVPPGSSLGPPSSCLRPSGGWASGSAFDPAASHAARTPAAPLGKGCPPREGLAAGGTRWGWRRGRQDHSGAAEGRWAPGGSDHCGHSAPAGPPGAGERGGPVPAHLPSPWPPAPTSPCRSCPVASVSPPPAFFRPESEHPRLESPPETLR